jgi:Ca-activated chloride channel homolog
MFFSNKSALKQVFRIGVFALIITVAVNSQNLSSLAYRETPPDNIIFILDNSGSMQVKDRDRRFKIDTAKDVIKENIDDPDLSRTNMGLIELGGNCAVNVLVDPSAGDTNRTSIKSKLNNIHRDGYMSGSTPIVKAIEKALGILETKNGTRKIVLISDGLPNCGQPNACDKVKEWNDNLLNKNIQFEMDIIGYGIKNNDDKEFKCIKKLSDRFSYTNTDNREELKQAVKNATGKSVPLPKASESPNLSSSPTLSPSPPPPPPGEQNPPWLQIVLGIIGAIGLIGAAFVGRKK